jgi:hypothetical protein
MRKLKPGKENTVMARRMLIALMIVTLLLGAGSTAFAAPIASQSSETQNGSTAVATPDPAQHQAEDESLRVGEISDEALWIILGITLVFGIVIIAA